MSTSILEVNPEELKVLVDHMVEEKLVELFGDPEDGLELHDELKERLLKQKSEMASGEQGQSFEDVIKRLGLN